MVLRFGGLNSVSLEAEVGGWVSRGSWGGELREVRDVWFCAGFTEEAVARSENVEV